MYQCIIHPRVNVFVSLTMTGNDQFSHGELSSPAQCQIFSFSQSHHCKGANDVLDFFRDASLVNQPSEFKIIDWNITLLYHVTRVCLFISNIEAHLWLYLPLDRGDLSLIVTRSWLFTSFLLRLRDSLNKLGRTQNPRNKWGEDFTQLGPGTYFTFYYSKTFTSTTLLRVLGFTSTGYLSVFKRGGEESL